MKAAGKRESRGQSEVIAGAGKLKEQVSGATLSYHVQPFTLPAMKVRQARHLLDFLAKTAGRESSPFGLLLQAELESFRHSSDSCLFHEHLEECNDPIYFYQFIERAAAKGLKYLGEADMRSMV